MNSPLRNPMIHITGHGPSGKAVIHSSTESKPTEYPQQKASLNLVYTTSGMPPDLNDDQDIRLHDAVRSAGTQEAISRPNGTVCRFVDFAPAMDSGMMHRTQSLDFGVVIEGEVILELDDGSETRMGKGDVCVQRGTMHAWKNASLTEWARMMFVLQGCKPLLVGGQAVKEDLSDAGEKIFPKSGDD